MPAKKQATPNEAYVYFGLRGDFDPERLTISLGIQPTSACAQGSRNPERGLPKVSIWKVSTERVVAEEIDIFELVDRVISQLENNVAQIRDAVDTLDLQAVLEIVLSLSTDDDVSTPAIGFSNRAVAFLAAVNASIDIDTYILPSDSSES